MNDYAIRTRPAAALLGSLALLGVCVAAGGAAAQGAAADEPLALTATDAALDWGPCPAFMPAGCALAVLHGDPSKANADVFFKVPGGATLPVHWHTSAERMVLVAGELRVTYAAREPVVLKPGTYAYGPPKHAHDGRCVSATPCILFIAFEGPVDATAGHGH